MGWKINKKYTKKIILESSNASKMTSSAVGAKKKASADAASGAEGCVVKFDSNNDCNAVSGWSEAVELDCCCVCHENGDLECPWCTGETECNLTKKRLGTK